MIKIKNRLTKQVSLLLVSVVTLLISASCPDKTARFAADTDPSTEAGRALADAFEDNPDLIGAWSLLDDAGVVLRKDPAWLKRVDDWQSNGIRVEPDVGQNKLKLLNENGGSEVAEVTSEGALVPKKYDFVPSKGKPKPGGKPIGEPQNGYQVYKHGDEVSVRRVADKSGYSQSQLNELTQHPKAHVLERHGHDVTDDALIRRANTGIAPDGSTTANRKPPPYSSKFDSPQKVIEALNNTKPGTPAFNNGIQQNDRRIVEFTSTTGDFGKGVRKDGFTFETTNKVLAIYQDLGGGDYQILTMYPDF